MAHPDGNNAPAQVLAGEGSGLTVVYAVKLKPDQVDNVLSQAMAMLPLARSQTGSRGLDVYQSPSDPTRIMMFEHWASEADLNRWLAADHLKAYFARLTPLLADPPVVTHWTLRSTGPHAETQGETRASPAISKL